MNNKIVENNMSANAEIKPRSNRLEERQTQNSAATSYLMLCYYCRMVICGFSIASY